MKESLFDLSGKVAVITGGAGMLGEQYALAIAAFEGTPVLLDTNQARLDEVAQKVKETSGKEALGLCVDITKEDEVKEACQTVQSQFNQIDILINNAAKNPTMKGTIPDSRLEQFSLDAWQQDLDVGLKGAFLCVKYFGHAMASSGSGGSIINVSSDLGLIGPDQTLYHQDGLSESEQPVKPVSYSVVKSGLIGLTRYIATYWPKQNVRCNAICPGGVLNDQDATFLERIQKKIPLGRMANVNEYQGIIIYLASDASSYMTGAVIAVDGGRTAW